MNTLYSCRFKSTYKEDARRFANMFSKVYGDGRMQNSPKCDTVMGHIEP